MFKLNTVITINFFFKQKTAYEITTRLVGSEMCIRDRFMMGGACSLTVTPVTEECVVIGRL